MTKKRLYFSLALLAHAVMAAAMFLNRWAMTIIWKHLLEGESVALCTHLSLKYGVIIPAIGMLAVVVIGWRSRSQGEESPFYGNLLITTAATLLMTALYMAGLVIPAFTSTWSLS